MELVHALVCASPNGVWSHFDYRQKHALLTTGMAPALFLQLLCGAAVAPEVFVALSSSVAPVAH